MAAEGDDVVCVWVSTFTGALPVASFAAAGSGGGVLAVLAAAGSGGGVWVLTAALLVADVPLPLFNFGF